MSCSPFDLRDYVFGELGEAERRQVDAHVRSCAGCYEDLERLRVTGEAVRVKVTDRGPFGHEDRIIDLSEAAAKKLGFLKAGVARVELRVVSGP